MRLSEQSKWRGGMLACPPDSDLSDPPIATSRRFLMPVVERMRQLASAEAEQSVDEVNKGIFTAPRFSRVLSLLS